MRRNRHAWIVERGRLSAVDFLLSIRLRLILRMGARMRQIPIRSSDAILGTILGTICNYLGNLYRKKCAMHSHNL